MSKIIVLSEIWISEAEKSFFQIPGYSLFINSNERFRAGGVAVYCHSSIEEVVPTVINCESADFLEIRFKELGYDFILLAVYRLYQFPISLFLLIFIKFTC